MILRPPIFFVNTIYDLRSGGRHRYCVLDPDGRFCQFMRTRIPTACVKRRNHYFSTDTFNGAPRAINALPTRIVKMDLDGAPIGQPPPSILIETSSGHYHTMHVLERAVDAHVAAQVSKAIAREWGADMSGYDVGQLLRIPATYNHKRGCWTRLLYISDRVYSLDALPSPPPPPKPVRRSDVPADTWAMIKYGAPDGGRYRLLWAVEHRLIRAGWTDDEIVAALTDPRMGISSKPLEMGETWLRGQIARARAKT
jgi:hypothetical protein